MLSYRRDHLHDGEADPMTSYRQFRSNSTVNQMFRRVIQSNHPTAESTLVRPRVVARWILHSGFRTNAPVVPFPRGVNQLWWWCPWLALPPHAPRRHHHPDDDDDAPMVVDWTTRAVVSCLPDAAARRVDAAARRVDPSRSSHRLHSCSTVSPRLNRSIASIQGVIITVGGRLRRTRRFR